MDLNRDNGLNPRNLRNGQGKRTSDLGSIE
jgi:hypothetical protein